MKPIAIDSPRSLLFALFVIFEALLVTSAVVLWCVDPRRMSGLDDAAGIAFWFSFVGLSIVCWLLRRVAPRLATVGFITVLASFAAVALLPAVP
jgi:apolipoprotein N-acyltransferase